MRATMPELDRKNLPGRILIGVCQRRQAINRQRIPPSAIRAAYTVRQHAAAVLRISPSSEERVTCAKDGRGLPLFFCHGDCTTRGFYALKLADMLTCARPVFLLHPYLDPVPKLTIEEMARSYLLATLVGSATDRRFPLWRSLQRRPTCLGARFPA